MLFFIQFYCWCCCFYIQKFVWICMCCVHIYVSVCHQQQSAKWNFSVFSFIQTTHNPLASIIMGLTIFGAMGIPLQFLLHSHRSNWNLLTVSEEETVREEDEKRNSNISNESQQKKNCTIHVSINSMCLFSLLLLADFEFQRKKKKMLTRLWRFNQPFVYLYICV